MQALAESPGVDATTWEGIEKYRVCGTDYQQRSEQLAQRMDFVESQSRTHPAALRCRDVVRRFYPDHLLDVDAIARGCILIESGLAFDGSHTMTDWGDMFRYENWQRACVERRGQCEGGCSNTVLREARDVTQICRRTALPCPAAELRGIVLAIGEINRPKNPNWKQEI